jgi:hypothetical protein
VRYTFEKAIAHLANSPLWVATIVILFGVSAAVFEFFIHVAIVITNTSPLAQAVLDAVIVGIAAGFAPLLILLVARERHRKVLEDLRKIAQLNHHVRNALQTIVYSEYLPRTEENRKAVLAGVDHIDTILQELFPVVGDRTDDLGWKVIRINQTKAFVPEDRRRGV